MVPRIWRPCLVTGTFFVKEGRKQMKKCKTWLMMAIVACAVMFASVVAAFSQDDGGSLLD